MQALFKARFEQALESQKLNIKKLEQELRRKGINPEDPVALASIQRVAATFFRAIDEKQGTPYVFPGDVRSGASTDEKRAPVTKDDEQEDIPGEDSDQEELDRFIAEIEEAADREFEEEEAADREEVTKIRYWAGDSSSGPGSHDRIRRPADVRRWVSEDENGESSATEDLDSEDDLLDAYDPEDGFVESNKGIQDDSFRERRASREKGNNLGSGSRRRVQGGNFPGAAASARSWGSEDDDGDKTDESNGSSRGRGVTLREKRENRGSGVRDSRSRKRGPGREAAASSEGWRSEDDQGGKSDDSDDEYWESDGEEVRTSRSVYDYQSSSDED